MDLIAAGDVMLGRGVEIRMARGKNPFEEVAPLLKQADIAFCNLEAMFCRNAPTAVIGPGFYTSLKLAALPERSQFLKMAGFDVVSLANNHAMDFGPAAIEETKSALKQNGIAYFGAGESNAEVCAPAIVESRGMRIAFLGYAFDHSPNVYASDKTPGIAELEPSTIRADIEKIRPRVDFVVVSLHWGNEYSHYPTHWQRQTAHDLIDAGADMILGHHPHVLQEIEEYHGKLIAYSLGNFVFDQTGEGTDHSLLLECRLAPHELKSFKVIPLTRWEGYFPQPANAEESRAILDEVKQ